jgi:hypothetical protein
MNLTQGKLHKYLLENGFVTAGIENYTVVKNFNADNQLNELTVCSIVTWSGELNTLYKIINGFLCIANFYAAGEISFSVIRSTAGDCLQNVVDTLYDLSINAGLDNLPVWFIEERFLEDYRSLKGYIVDTVCTEDIYEYIFNTDSLLNLDGRANKERRRLLRRFSENSNVSVKPITKENISLCLGIDEKWCNSQDCDQCRAFVACSKNALKIMINIFDDSVYQGVLGFIDDLPVSYLIFEKAGDDIAYFHYSKTIVPNFCYYIYYTTIKHYLYNIKKVNFGIDLGNQGLRFYKRNLGEYEFLRSYICTLIREK